MPSTVVLKKTLEDSKDSKPVNLKGNKPWILIGRTDAEAEAPVFWSSNVNSQLIGKAPEAGRDWGQKEKRATEDKMPGWHHWCNRHELGQTPGDGEGQGGLACCSSWGHKQSVTNVPLDKNNNTHTYVYYFKRNNRQRHEKQGKKNNYESTGRANSVVIAEHSIFPELLGNQWRKKGKLLMV